MKIPAFFNKKCILKKYKAPLFLLLRIQAPPVPRPDLNFPVRPNLDLLEIKNVNGK